ncbi:MAG: cyclic nucleotide-binding domain-containing protein, partial [Bacteroidaceae bacterium]|nr:cyclic nucleotide-binding domain-containing protein [Bacteroidaceae bacterium]
MTVESVVDFQEVASRISKLWNLLSAPEREAVESSARLRSYRKNELIYQEGENPDHLLCLLSGKVKIFRDGVGGRSQIMRLMRPVQYFGYRASLAQEPYVTAAAAFEPSLVCSIPMPVITGAMATNNALCRFFISELATDLGISDKRTVSLTQKH